MRLLCRRNESKVYIELFRRMHLITAWRSHVIFTTEIIPRSGRMKLLYLSSITSSHADLTLRLATLAVIMMFSWASPTEAQVIQEWSFESIADLPDDENVFPQEDAAVTIDTTLNHSGKGSLRIDCKREDGNCEICYYAKSPERANGKSVRVSAFTHESNSKDAGIVLSVSATSLSGVSSWSEGRWEPRNGEWRQWSHVIVIAEPLKDLSLCISSNQGSIWVDDVAVEAVSMGINIDNEFYEGSGIQITSLSQEEVLSVALGGRVWGFLKYHDPRVATGMLNWDYELFRLLHRVLDSSDNSPTTSTILDWVASFGPVPRCSECVELPDNIQSAVDLSWIEDEVLLGPDLASFLRDVYQNRPVVQDWVRTDPLEELDYSNFEDPDTGYRLLTLFRIWNIVEYWFPYKQLIDRDWVELLPEYVSASIEALTLDQFMNVLAMFLAEQDDNHAGFPGYGTPAWAGECRLPVRIEYIEERPVVVALVDSLVPAAVTIPIGSEIILIGGVSVQEKFNSISPYIRASNPWSKRRKIEPWLTAGECETIKIEYRTVEGVEAASLERTKVYLGRPPHDRAGEAFQTLTDEIAYLKASDIKGFSMMEYVEGLLDKKALIVDIRGYPPVWRNSLAEHYLAQRTPFATFTYTASDNPGVFRWRDEPLYLEPKSPSLEGQIVILVDGLTQSSAETLAMTFQAIPNATVIGSFTAGANGNTWRIPLIGGIRFAMTGIGVFYPDRTPTQQVGIIPDIWAEPTIQGLRKGRDEVLEAALRFIMGSGSDEVRIREIARKN